MKASYSSLPVLTLFVACVLSLQSCAQPGKMEEAPIFLAIDNLLKSLRAANIAFNAPDKMQIDERYDIHLVLSSSQSIDELQAELKRRIGENKRLEGYEVRITPRMEARLTGQNFKIEAVTPETQAISTHEMTEWQWDVKPERGGKQVLHLTLNALVYVQNTSTPRTIRSFDRTIEVQVSRRRLVSDWFRDNWYWIGTVIVPLVIWWWRNRRSGKKPRKWDKP